MQRVAERQGATTARASWGLAQFVPFTLYSFSKAVPKYKIFIIPPGMGWLACAPPPSSSHVDLLIPGALGM